MDQANESATLSDKLTGPITAVIDKRRADLIPLLQGSTGQAAQAALRDDECVRKVATFCYPLLPVLAPWPSKNRPSSASCSTTVKKSSVA